MTDLRPFFDTPLPAAKNVYNGKIYRIGLPQSGEIQLSLLEEELDGSSYEIDESSRDFGDRDELVIPDVFESDVGSLDSSVARVDETKRFTANGTNGLLGSIVHEVPSTVEHGGCQILMLSDKQNEFVIFEVSGHLYLCILASRKRFSLLKEFLTEELGKFGFTVSSMDVSNSAFRDIHDDVVNNLRITTIEGYPGSSISKKRLMGVGYGSDAEYQEETRGNTVSGQQFDTEDIDGSERTVQISGDGLVRCYHKLTFEAYLSLLTDHIIPHIDSLSQPPIQSYISEADNATAESSQDD